jgi:hypothetical protein
MLSHKLLSDSYNCLSNKWNRLRVIHYEISNKVYKIKNIKKIMQNLSGDFPPNYDDLCKKNEIEIACLEIKLEELDKKMHDLWDEMENIFKITKKNSKLKKITKLEKKHLEKEICSICFEQHDVKQLVSTNCNHIFGKQCLNQLIVYNYDNCIETACPCCRNNKIEFTIYC